MAFVKLDCGILDSTLWPDIEARNLFITALLMAVPHELQEPVEALEVKTMAGTGFLVPCGWYGFVRAAGQGIVRRSGMELEAGMAALERLAAPEPDSRTPDHEGRRMVRVAGGYIILNFDLYRTKDHTAKERSKRYREKKFKIKKPKRTGALTAEAATERALGNGSITQDEADARAAVTREFSP